MFLETMMAHKFAGLSARGTGILMMLGFETKAEVVDAIKTDPDRIKKAPGCGPARWKDICDWAGMPQAAGKVHNG